MKKLSLRQDTPEWKELRLSKLGASDIGKLMTGSDKEIYELYEVKLGLRETYVTKSMKVGKEREKQALAQFNLRKGKQYEDAVYQSDEHEWLIASFDGFLEEDGSSVEIKCPSFVPEKMEQHPMYKEWWWQMQAHYAVGSKQVFFHMYTPEYNEFWPIEKDEEAIQKLLEKGKWFNDLLANQTPPKQPVVLRQDADAKEFAADAKRIKMRKEEAKEVEEEWEILRQSGIYLADGQPFECDEVKVVRTDPKEKIDWEAAFKALVPNWTSQMLTPFKQMTKPVWKVLA